MANGWTCKFCTYQENELEYLKCIMCNMSRNATEQEKCPVCFTEVEIPADKIGGFQCPICDTVFAAKFPHKAKSGGPRPNESKAAHESRPLSVHITPPPTSCPICFSEIDAADNFRCNTCGHQDLSAQQPAAVAAIAIDDSPPPSYEEARRDPPPRSIINDEPGGAKSCATCFSEVTQAQGWVCSVCGCDNADPGEEKAQVEEIIIEHSIDRKESDSEEEPEMKRVVDAKQDAVVSPKCPMCFATNNVLFSQQSHIQCIICDNFFTGNEEAPEVREGAAHPLPIASKTITKVKGQAAINRYEAISSLHNTFVYDCPVCLAVLQVPRAEKDNFKCAVCGHLCSIKFREQKKKYIHARAANARKLPNYKTIKKRGGEVEWKKRAVKINEVEALLYSPFAREMNLHRDVQKVCDCVDHQENHAPLARDDPETLRKNRKASASAEKARRVTEQKREEEEEKAQRLRVPTVAGGGDKRRITEAKRRVSDDEDDEKGFDEVVEEGRGRLASVAGARKKKKEKKKKEELPPKEERLFSVCLTCQERLCEKCENVIHSHLERADHKRISFVIFQQAKALFLKLDDLGDMTDGKIPCVRLEQVCSGFFPKASARTISAVLRQNVDNFGNKYEMDFRTFLQEIAPRLPLEGSQMDQHKSYLQRMDTDQLLNIHAQEYKKQKCWSRAWQKPKTWLQQVLPGYFELWGTSIRKVEATHGAHIASYFYFSRWLFLVNLVVAILYSGFIIFPWLSMGRDTITGPYNWWGMIVGYGLEGSMMFYGDYRYLKNPYEADLVYSNVTTLVGGHDFAQDRATFVTSGPNTFCRASPFLMNDVGPSCGSSLGCYYQVEPQGTTARACQNYCRVNWCTGVQFTAPDRCELWRVPIQAFAIDNMTTGECFNKDYVDVGVTSLYPEDTAWIIMYALMLLVTVLGIIQHLGRGHSSNLKEDPQFAFSNVVFTAIDFNVTHKRTMGLLRMNLVTTLDELLKYKAEEKLKQERKAHEIDEEAEKNAWKVFSGIMTCLVLAVGNWVGFYYMFDWEFNTLILDSSEKRPFFLMICPLIVSTTKVILPKMFNQIISMEGHVRSGPIFRHYFARVFILALSYIAFFLVIGVYREPSTLLSRDQCLQSENGILFYRIIVAEIVVEAVAVLVYPAIRMQLRRLSAKLMSYRSVRGGVDRMRRTMTMRFRPSARKLQRHGGGELDHQDIAEVGDNEDQLEEELKLQRLQHQHSRALLDQAHLEDPTKTVFNITDNMIGIVYLQTLIFCGLLYCPALPLVGILFHTVLFYTKRQQVAWFTKRSKRPMSVARQNRFFRIALVVSLLTTILPFTSFLRSQPTCGPHGQDGSSRTVADSFTQTVNAWPNAVVVVVGYLTNQMLLWMLLICFVIWAAALVNRSKSISKEITATSMRLKMETYERKKIIKEYNISLGYDEVRGRDMIAAFIAQLGPLGTKYVAPLKEYGYGDLVRLCKLNRDQLSGLLVRVHAKPDEIETILAAVDEKRLELM